MQNQGGNTNGPGVSADAVDQESRDFAARVDHLVTSKNMNRHDAAYQAKREDQARVEAMTKAGHGTPQGQQATARAPQSATAAPLQKPAVRPRHTEADMVSVQTDAVHDMQNKHRKAASQSEGQKTGQTTGTAPARRSDTEVSDKEHARQSYKPGGAREADRYRELMQVSNQQAARGGAGRGHSR